jgi:hypothetical protein
MLDPPRQWPVAISRRLFFRLRLGDVMHSEALESYIRDQAIELEGFPPHAGH